MNLLSLHHLMLLHVRCFFNIELLYIILVQEHVLQFYVQFETVAEMKVEPCIQMNAVRQSNFLVFPYVAPMKNKVKWLRQ